MDAFCSIKKTVPFETYYCFSSQNCFSIIEWWKLAVYANVKLRVVIVAIGPGLSIIWQKDYLRYSDAATFDFNITIQ
jgi:hypothetical protein